MPRAQDREVGADAAGAPAHRRSDSRSTQLPRTSTDTHSRAEAPAREATGSDPPTPAQSNQQQAPVRRRPHTQRAYGPTSPHPYTISPHAGSRAQRCWNTRTTVQPLLLAEPGDSTGRHLRISSVEPHRLRLDVSSIAALTLLVLVQPAGAAAKLAPHVASTGFQTTRTFALGAGRATRTFTLRERDGVILVNRLTVSHGVRAFVEARSPGLAGTRVSSWMSRNDPSLVCRRRGSFDVCSQSEEWCPMPQAAWHFRLVKLSGPAGPVRFDYVVAAPPAQG